MKQLINKCRKQEHNEYKNRRDCGKGYPLGIMQETDRPESVLKKELHNRAFGTVPKNLEKKLVNWRSEEESRPSRPPKC